MVWFGRSRICRVALLALGALVSVWLGASSGAHAQAHQRDSRARRHFEAGASYMESKAYADALREFEQAYKLSPRPALLYNIGVAAQHGGDHARAVDAYEAFVASGQAGDLEAEVDQRLTEVRSALQPQRAPEAAAAQAEARVQDDTSGESSADGAGAFNSAQAEEEKAAPGWPKWAVIGAGGAMVVAGATVFVLGAKDVGTVEDAERGSEWADVESAYERSSTRTLLGGVLMGVGAAAAAGGLVWWVLAKDDKPDSAQIGLSPAAGGLLASGRF